MYDPEEDYEDLENLREQMFEALKVAATIVNRYPAAMDRANAYWIAEIKTALGNKDYPTRAPTMLDTMAEIGEQAITFRYLAMLRPVTVANLPANMPEWRFAHEPGTVEGGRYGIIETTARLSADDRDRFGLRLV